MKYLITIYHPDDYEAFVVEDEAMDRAIDAVNEEMVEAGVRVYVGGLQPPRTAKSLRAEPSGTGAVLVTDGPYLETKEHIGGLWVIDAADMDEALEWGRKATIACRVPVQVRPFY